MICIGLRAHPPWGFTAKVGTRLEEGTMKKLTLNVEALEVQTFETADPQASRGTVLGAEAFLTAPDVCVTVGCGDSSVRPCLAD